MPRRSRASATGPNISPITTASEEIISGERVNEQPFTRPAEALEAVPGLVVTQHSGEGKANQYFLRGFNLDHGTDLAITVDGMPVNMRTHGHGQGYADLNFLIPELVKSMRVRKGPYFADEGDFSSAGAIHIDYIDRLAQGFAQLTGGSFGYWRALTAKSVRAGDGELLTQVYDQLRAVAQVRMADERAGHSLQATELVNEAYLRLHKELLVLQSDRPRFFRAAAATGLPHVAWGKAVYLAALLPFAALVLGLRGPGRLSPPR